MNSKIKILIADDDQDDKDMICEGLSEVFSNFQVETASDGVECLRALKNGCNPDLVFLDLNMPLKNGLECLQDIHNNEYLKNTPIVIYSTSQNLTDIEKASELGDRFYMIKPTTVSTLQQLLRHVLNMLGRPQKEQKLSANFVVSEEKITKVNNYLYSYYHS